MTARDLTFALRAIKIIKDDSGSVPTLFNLLDDASVVYNMTTVKLDARLLTQAGGPANGAELLLVNIWYFAWAIRLETRQVLALPAYTTTRMTTFQDLIAKLVDHGLAIDIAANVCECLATIDILLLELSQAKPTRCGTDLLARLTDVIRRDVTLGTEILFALIAPDSELCHMLGSLI